LRGYAGDTVDEAGDLVTFGEGFGGGGTNGDDFAGVVAADCCVVLGEVVDVLPAVMGSAFSEGRVKSADALLTR